MTTRNRAGGVRVPAPGGYEREAADAFGAGVWKFVPLMRWDTSRVPFALVVEPQVRDPLEVWLENVKDA